MSSIKKKESEQASKEEKKSTQKIEEEVTETQDSTKEEDVVDLSAEKEKEMGAQVEEKSEDEVKSVSKNESESSAKTKEDKSTGDAKVENKDIKTGKSQRKSNLEAYDKKTEMAPLPKDKRIKKLNVFSKVGIGKEQEFFLENLSMIFATGVDIIASLDAIKEGLRTPQMIRLVEDVQMLIQDGVPIWQAFEMTNLLSASEISLIRIGEETGKLTENLKVVVRQQEKNRNFRGKLRSAMMYPLLILGVTLFLGIGISWFLLPRLSNVFTSVGEDLPITTEVLMAFGEFLQANGYYVIPLFLLFLGILLYFLFAHSKTKFIGQWILFHTPVISTLVQQVEVSRFGYILGNLLDSGIPVVNALESLRDSASYRVYKNFYNELAHGVEEGKSFYEVFKEYKGSKKLIPFHIQHMVSSAEKSGQLRPVLVKIAEVYEEKVELTTKNLTVLLEPIMLFIVWGGVVVLALAVVTPIYTLLGGINKGSNPPPPRPAAPVVKEGEKGEAIGEGAEEVDTDEEEGEDVEESEAENKLIVTSTGIGTLNVRLSPSLNGSILTQVIEGGTYVYVDVQDGWYQVEVPSTEDDEKELIVGWVSGDYVEILDQKEE